METNQKKSNPPEPQTQSLASWQTATNPLCLRIETVNKTYLFPYGYFRRATFAREGNKEIIEILFQDSTVIAKGSGLEILCDALSRFGVDFIVARPVKYVVRPGVGCIQEITVRENTETVASFE